MRRVSDPLLLQRVRQRLLGYDRASGGIHEKRWPTHEAKLPMADQVRASSGAPMKPRVFAFSLTGSSSAV